MVDNFANVSIPGMGISLRHFVSNRVTAFVLVTCIYPAVSFVAAFHLWVTTVGSSSISDEYATRLLTPNDWFNYWRLNSRIAAFHSYITHPNSSRGYSMENKWTFLQEGTKLDVPVSPYLSLIVRPMKRWHVSVGVLFLVVVVYTASIDRRVVAHAEKNEITRGGDRGSASFHAWKK
jgi:hypothetical protein